MTDNQIRDLLDRASADVPEVDFTGTWGSGHTRHRRRRLTWAGAAAAAALVATAAVTLRPDTTVPAPAGPSTAASSTSSASEAATETNGWKRSATGISYVMGPVEGQEADLPILDLGTPARISLTEAVTPFSTLSARVARPWSAMFLEPMGDGPVEQAQQFRPVLVLKDGSLVALDRVQLTWLRDAQGNTAMPLSMRVFNADRTRAVFAQPGALVVVDLVTGQATRHAIADANVTRAGWYPTDTGGEVAAVFSETSSWALQSDGSVTSSGGTRPVGTAGPEKWPVGTVASEVWRDNPGFYAADLMLEPNLVGLANPTISQGISAREPAETSRNLRVLAIDESAGLRNKGCCAITQVDRSGPWVVFSSAGATSTWLLAWDTVTGQVRKVMEVTNADPGQRVAMAPFG